MPGAPRFVSFRFVSFRFVSFRAPVVIHEVAVVETLTESRRPARFVSFRAPRKFKVLFFFFLFDLP